MKNVNKIIKYICLGILGLLLIVVLLTGINILFFWSIFNWLQDIIHQATGLNESLVKGLAAILMAFIVMFPLGKLALAFTPVPQKNKGLYRLYIFIAIAIISLFIYFGSRNTYFNPKTGKPLKYYSISPTGTYKFFSEPGYDPETGDKLQVVTKEIVLKSKGINPVPRPKIDYQPPVKIPTNQITPSQNPPPQQTSDFPAQAGEDAPPQPRSSGNSNSDNNDLASRQRAPDFSSSANSGNQIYRPSRVIKSTKTRITEPTNTQNNWGRLKFDNQSNYTLWITTTFNKRVLNVGPRQVLTCQMAPGKYLFTNGNGTILGHFFVEERKSCNVAYISRKTTQRIYINNPPVNKKYSISSLT